MFWKITPNSRHKEKKYQIMKKPFFKFTYLNKLSLEELHHESQTWMSTLAFWKEEVDFMLHLVDDHFFYFLSKDKANTLQPLLLKIRDFKKKVIKAETEKIERHEMILTRMVQNPENKDESTYRSQHEELAHEMVQLATNFRLVKAELFRMAREVLKEEKYQQLEGAAV